MNGDSKAIYDVGCNYSSDSGHHYYTLLMYYVVTLYKKTFLEQFEPASHDSAN